MRREVTALVLIAGCRAPAASPVATPIPQGMVLIHEGDFVRGQDTPARPDEAPAHRVFVHRFFLDATLVSRGDFARFVAETGYRTTAERIGFGMASWDGMDDWEWERVPGASWREPMPPGTPGAEAFQRDDAPVVMVSFDDAEAYCSHERRRLPTEAEWEYAMRAGATGRFPWGDSPRRKDGAYLLNFFQGESHRKNLVEDGYLYVSPVRAFPPNAWGIYDPVGNVWQWTHDFYAPDTYARSAAAGGVTDPKGPATGTTRVLRGGSWWCGACTCEGYGLEYRGKANPSAPFNNNGFRCAADA